MNTNIEKQKELKKAIDNFKLVDSNKKLMIEYLSEENIINYPFDVVKIILARSESQGTEILEVNLRTFRNEHYCDVASMGEILLNDKLLEKLRSVMIDNLE
ncbi:hypothetical protein [Empedobacter sp.]|uniref:hypothetical protein n=1 Tax=Empedobacter sp. TaxID=1927715 RepID=UPI00289B546A|nr:hypothetical protein [Empedobacter sp.]